MPLVGKSGVSIPVVLPRLVDLRLDGVDTVIAGFMDLVSMSSPLHNVVIRFRGRTYGDSTRASAIKKIITLYYEYLVLEYPRKLDHLTISPNLFEDVLVFDARSYSTPTFHPMYNLQLRLPGTHHALTLRTIPLFPLKNIREFTAAKLDLDSRNWREVLQEVEGLLHLQLDGLGQPELALGALGFDDGGVCGETIRIILDRSHPHSQKREPTNRPQTAIAGAPQYHY